MSRSILICLISLLAALVATSSVRAAATRNSTAPASTAQARAALAAKFSGSSIDTMQGAAAGGSVAAMTRLAYLYASGQGISRDQAQALRWYKRAAELGFALAQVELALIYDCGCGVTESRDEAIRWMTRAADQNYPPAFYGLGWFHSNHKALPGETITGDYLLAAEWFAKAADQGNGEAAYKIAEFHVYGKLERDSAAADRWFKRAAELGFGKGRSTPDEQYDASIRDQIEELRVAAKLGSADAAFKIGVILAGSYRTSSQRADALPWFRQAAAQGHVQALLIVAECLDPSADLFSFRNSRVGHDHAYWVRDIRAKTFEPDFRDVVEAERLRRQAGVRLFQIAREFWKGDRLPKDIAHASSLAQRAVELGNADAENLLGELWKSGATGSPDAKEALRWFRRSAVNGSRDGQFQLGRAILHGEGTATNDLQATMWLTIADDRGHADARKELTQARTRLAPELLAEAQKRAKAFLGKDLNRAR